MCLDRCVLGRNECRQASVARWRTSFLAPIRPRVGTDGAEPTLPVQLFDQPCFSAFRTGNQDLSAVGGQAPDRRGEPPRALARTGTRSMPLLKVFHQPVLTR